MDSPILWCALSQILPAFLSYFASGLRTKNNDSRSDNANQNRVTRSISCTIFNYIYPRKQLRRVQQIGCGRAPSIKYEIGHRSDMISPQFFPSLLGPIFEKYSLGRSHLRNVGSTADKRRCNYLRSSAFIYLDLRL